MTFVADAPDVPVATTVLEVVETGALADGTATNSVRAHITDANGILPQNWCYLKRNRQTELRPMELLAVAFVRSRSGVGSVSYRNSLVQL